MGTLGQSLINNQLTETHVNFLLHLLWELIIVVWGRSPCFVLFCFLLVSAFSSGGGEGGAIVLQMETRESYRLGKCFYHPAGPRPTSSLITKFKMKGGEKVRQQTGGDYHMADNAEVFCMCMRRLPHDRNCTGILHVHEAITTWQTLHRYSACVEQLIQSTALLQTKGQHFLEVLEN